MSIILILLCSNFSHYIYAEEVEEQENILIINSYHQGFTWSKDQTDGIIEILKNSEHNISLFTEYMDWKNYSEDTNLEYLYDIFKYKYQNKNIDILIVTDDVAFEFALKNRAELFSDAPIVFSGVNQDGLVDIGSGYKNFTGVLEEVDPTETMEMALTINPSLKNAYILFDNSESGVSTGKIVVDKIKSMGKKINTISLNNLSYDQLIEDVGNCKDDSIVVITTYYSDVSGQVVELEKVSREISKNSNVPVYHLYDVGLNNGSFGGAMIEGKSHGESAAELAIRILDGEDPDNIPIISSKSTRKVFDYNQLQRFNISINNLPKNSEVINKPFSFFNTYKRLIIFVVSIFIFLVLLISALIFYILRIKKMEKNLSESYEELTQVYEELTASEEELRQQFDEISSSHEKIKKAEERLTYLAYHDTLTKLPNKLWLYEKSYKDIFICKKGKAALLFLDIDHFKYINDTMGHAFGDKLIIEVGQRLASLLCESSSIYRLNGDEFIIILQNIKEIEDAELFSSRIMEEFEESFNVLDSALYISLSIGIVMYPEHGDNIEELLKCADIAMYKAKDKGRKGYAIYDDQMNRNFTERANIEKHLHMALENKEFEIYYQPQLDLKSNKTTGFEALLRWENPELGRVSTIKLIKVAEDTHLIIPLGRWILKNACHFLKKLHRKGYVDLSVSVNISMLQLVQTDFNDMVMDTLEFFDLSPHHLELEITESILIESFEVIGVKLEKLKMQGVKIALDDFGKGYSSLSYLKQLPISTLKIDKTFIDDIFSADDNNNLTGQIITIGKSMGINVIAEGVERKEQLEYVSKYGCDKIQGYLYSRPVPEAEIIKMLKNTYRIS